MESKSLTRRRMEKRTKGSPNESIHRNVTFLITTWYIPRGDQQGVASDVCYMEQRSFVVLWPAVVMWAICASSSVAVRIGVQREGLVLFC